MYINEKFYVRIAKKFIIPENNENNLHDGKIKNRKGWF